MNSVKPQRNRGRILSDQGWKKLEDASWKTFKKVVDDFTNEQLKDLTGLDEDTITKILRRERGADQRSINRLFNPFGLQLQEGDLTYPTQGSRSHSATVSQPQEQAQEETPSNNPKFVGREKAIADLNTLVNKGAKVILIQAEGGIGKTTLAKKWFEHQGLEPLELRVGTTSQNIQSAEDWVRLTLRNYFKESPETNFLTMLEQLKGKLQHERIGVLIDNLETALTNGEFIEPHNNYVELLTVLAHSSVQSVTLITSREPLHEPGLALQLALQTVANYPLEGLNIEAWQQYFDSRHISKNIDALHEMHQAYGGNAEVMFILSGDIQKQSQGNLKTYWQHNRDDLLRHPTLEKLVQRQFNKLKLDNPKAHNLLCRFGFYPNQDIQPVPKVWLFCLLWDVPENRRQRVIDALCDRSLVKVSDEGYYLHPMIRAEAVEMMDLSEESILKQIVLIKSQIDGILASDVEDESLQNFLIQLNKKSKEVNASWKVAVIRACYFWIFLDCKFSPAFPIIKSIDNNCDRELDRVYYLPNSPCFDMDLILAKALGCDLDLSLHRVLIHTISHADEHIIEFPPADELPAGVAIMLSNLNAFYSSMACNEVKNIEYALEFDLSSKLKELLQKMTMQIKIRHPDIVNNLKYRKEMSLSVMEELREILIEEHNIGYNWQFSSVQKESLKQYYKANELLVDCLKNASDGTRSHIEKTLLLPIAEIEKLKPQD